MHCGAHTCTSNSTSQRQQCRKPAKLGLCTWLKGEARVAAVRAVMTSWPFNFQAAVLQSALECIEKRRARAAGAARDASPPEEDNDDPGKGREEFENFDPSRDDKDEAATRRGASAGRGTSSAWAQATAGGPVARRHRGRHRGRARWPRHSHGGTGRRGRARWAGRSRTNRAGTGSQRRLHRDGGDHKGGGGATRNVRGLESSRGRGPPGSVPHSVWAPRPMAVARHISNSYC